MGMVGSFPMWIWKCVRRRYRSRKIPVKRGYLHLFNVVIRSIPSIKGRYRPPILCKSVRAYPMKRCIIVLTASHHNVRLFYPVVVLPILIRFHPPLSWRHRPFPSIFHPPSSWRHRPVPSSFHLPPNLPANNCVSQSCDPTDAQSCSCRAGLQCRNRGGQGYLCSAMPRTSRQRLSGGRDGVGGAGSRDRNSSF